MLFQRGHAMMKFRTMRHQLVFSRSDAAASKKEASTLKEALRLQVAGQIGYYHPSQSGLSLIELMIAMTMGLMITISLGYILIGSQSTYRSQSSSTGVQDTGRMAMEFIGRNLRAAGRIEIIPLAGDDRVTLPGAAVPISGLNDTVTVNTGGTPTTRTVDTLTVQYQLSNLNGVDVADCNGSSGSALAVASLTSISGITGSVCGSAGNQPCKYGTVSNTISLDEDNLELECEGNGADAAQPFAEGVEDMQFLYGLDTTGDDAVDSWQAAVPASLAQIVAVQVCILVRSQNTGAVNTPQTLRDCSGTSFTAGDTRLRRTFTSVFTLRNRVNLLPQ